MFLFLIRENMTFYIVDDMMTIMIMVPVLYSLVIVVTYVYSLHCCAITENNTFIIQKAKYH